MLIRQHHEEVARVLREKSEEPARVGDYRQKDNLDWREVPFDPMRRRTFVTWVWRPRPPVGWALPRSARWVPPTWDGSSAPKPGSRASLTGMAGRPVAGGCGVGR
jgi:hypothetical protein